MCILWSNVAFYGCSMAEIGQQRVRFVGMVSIFIEPDFFNNKTAKILKNIRAHLEQFGRYRTDIRYY
jgi:hypothetical protein